MAEVLRGRFAGIDLDELVDWRVVRTWLYWGMLWLLLAPSIGVAPSGLFNFPDYLGSNNLGLTFGRLRPVHVNGVIFGAFSSLFIGECYYLVPRLCGVRRAVARMGRAAGLGVEHYGRARAHLAALWRKQWPRSGRVSPVCQNPDLHCRCRSDGAISDHHRSAP